MYHYYIFVFQSRVLRSSDSSSALLMCVTRWVLEEAFYLFFFLLFVLTHESKYRCPHRLLFLLLHNSAR